MWSINCQFFSILFQIKKVDKETETYFPLWAINLASERFICFLIVNTIGIHKERYIRYKGRISSELNSFKFGFLQRSKSDSFLFYCRVICY